MIDALRCMPGVGQKSAQRIAFHLLERDRDGASALAAALAEAVQGIGHCKRCRMFTEHELCSICSASGRDESQLCIVESPADVMAVEDATGFRGLYFVLMGHLSPLDGIGPEELGLNLLEERLSAGGIDRLLEPRSWKYKILIKLVIFLDRRLSGRAGRSRGTPVTEAPCQLPEPRERTARPAAAQSIRP